MRSKSRTRRLIALSVAGVLGVTAAVIVVANVDAQAARTGYQASLQQTEAAVAQATTDQGFTPEDVAPVAQTVASIKQSEEPLWVGARGPYYRDQARALEQQRRRLAELEQSLTADAQGQVGSNFDAVAAQLSQDQQLGVDASDLQPIQVRLNQLSATRAAASRIADYRQMVSQVAALKDQATSLGTAQKAENDAITVAAADLTAKNAGNLDAIRKIGAKALADGRDDATIAGFMAQQGTLKAADAVNRAYKLLEKYPPMLGAAELDKVAFAASAEARYAAQVKDALTKNMPDKTIVIYIQDQYLQLYDHGNIAVQTVVTTGRPALPTDIGPMKILWRASPWKMHSPWPEGSPFWYPDSDVRKVMWFTATGEGLHDASWRSWYGPGSNYGDGTHGCVNLPGGFVDQVWDDAPDGTPVIVIPGTGQTQAEQLSQDTIDTAAGQAIKGA